MNTASQYTAFYPFSTGILTAHIADIQFVLNLIKGFNNFQMLYSPIHFHDLRIIQY